MDNIYLINEENEVNFKSYDQLSYANKGDLIELYIDSNYVGDVKVWKDSQMNDREYITINHEIIYLDTLTNKKDAIKIWSVWENDVLSQGKDYPTFYKNKSDAQNHFNNSKEGDTEYVSIRECIVRGWGTDKMEILEESIIDNYHAD